MPPVYYCLVCGNLAAPANSYLIAGRTFVHRACMNQALDADPDWDPDTDTPDAA